VAKFKLLRRVLKKWAMGLSKLKQMVKQCNNVPSIIDNLEENRGLYPQSRILGESSKNTFSSYCRIKKNTREKGAQ
jgi:hypothetical protein